MPTSNPKLDEIKKFSEARMFSAIFKYLGKDERAPGLHVTQTAKLCSRRSAWEYEDGIVDDGESNSLAGLDERAAITFFVGKKVHESELSEIHEQEIEYQKGDFIALHGTIDDAIITRSMVIILDKKSTRDLPDYPRSHHKSQIEHYAVALWNATKIVSCTICGHKKITNVEKPTLWQPCLSGPEHKLVESKVSFSDREFYGSVIYINVGKPESMWQSLVRAFPFEIQVADKTVPDTKNANATKTIPGVNSTLDEKLVIVSAAVKSGNPAPSTYSWECNTPCPYFTACRKVDAGDADWKSYLPHGRK